MSMTVREILSLGEKQLKECGIEDATRDSKSLYCYLIGIPEDKLFMEYKYTLQDLLCDQYFDLVDRRAAGEPLQYIVGSQGFMGLTFKVDPRVLIPRMDTETLVRHALSIIKEGKLADEGGRACAERTSWNVLDLCTGSGAIGISIAKLSDDGRKDGIKVMLSDISEDALSVARENIELNGVGDKVKTAKGDLFTPFKKLFGRQKFDMIVSNPPYVRADVIPTLQKEIREHEPMNALDGGEDGLCFYRRIAEEAKDYLASGGVLLLEIGDDQGEDVKNIFSERYENVRVLQDLAGRDRVVFALYEGKN